MKHIKTYKIFESYDVVDAKYTYETELSKEIEMITLPLCTNGYRVNVFFQNGGKYFDCRIFWYSSDGIPISDKKKQEVEYDSILSHIIAEMEYHGYTLSKISDNKTCLEFKENI